MCNVFCNLVFVWTISNEIDFNFHETSSVSIYHNLRPMMQEILCSALDILSVISYWSRKFLTVDLQVHRAGNKCVIASCPGVIHERLASACCLHSIYSFLWVCHGGWRCHCFLSRLFIFILTTELWINFSKNLSKCRFSYLKDKDLLGRIRNPCQVSPMLSSLPLVSAG